MTIKLTPFNVRLLQLSDQAVRGLRQITTQDTFDGATKNFHPDGLFSNEIFGQNGEKSRMRRFAYIDLKVPILHPFIYRTLSKLKRIYPEIMAGRQYAKWDEETQDLVKSDPIDGQTGYTFFMNHFPKIMFPERLSDQRALNIKLINRTRDTAINTRVIVAPAGYRDYVIIDDREEEDEVNKLYRKLLMAANPISMDMYNDRPETYDRVRFGMQVNFNLIYEYYESTIRGKNKLILGHVMTRQVRDGTRNVLTTQNLDVKELFGDGTPTTNSTGIGLFQFVKAFRPKCLYHVQNGFLKEVFRSPGAPARLVDPKTLTAVEVQLPMKEYDNWMTSEGIEKLFNLFSENERRSDPLMVGDYYLGLLYNDGKKFKIFSDINELPGGYDPKNVSPMTFAEFLYSQVFHVEKEVTLNVTRFPVTGFGSIYPSEPFLKVTTETLKLWPMNEYWEVDESRGIAREFPIRTEAYIDTMMPAPDKLAGLTADFDGDKGTGNGVYTDEGVAESKLVMRSRAYHIKTDASIAHSLATDTVNYLFGAMTGPLRLTQADVDKFKTTYGELVNIPALATEEIKEDLTGIPSRHKERMKRKKESKEAFHKPNGSTSSVFKKIDMDAINRGIVEEYKSRKDLLQAVSDYMQSPNRAHMPKLREMAALVNELQPGKDTVLVYRGFDVNNNQEDFGIVSPKEGDVAFFQSQFKTISTSTDKEVSRSYGSVLVEIELGADDSFLHITDELAVACSEVTGSNANNSQKEIVILPPMRFGAKVVEFQENFFKRDFGDATVQSEIAPDVVHTFESYREPNSTFESDGVQYDLNKIFAIVEANPLMREIPIGKLNWVLDFDSPDPVRVQDADLSYPIIVIPFKMGTYLTVDGLHRVAKASQEGVQKLVAYVITAKQLAEARI